jgi:hypothetical protein
VVVAALILAGCAAAQPTSPPSARPSVEAAELVRRWESEWRGFTGLRAALDVTITRRGRAQRSAAVMLVSPTHLRVEVATPFGLPSLIMTAGPDEMLVWNPVERRAWMGQPTAESVSRWLGIPLAPATLIRILVGTVPLPAEAAAARLDDRGGAHLAFEQDAVRHRVWVTAEGAPVLLRIEAGGELIVRFARSAAGLLETLTIEAPGPRVEAQVRYLVVEPVSPSPDAFVVRIPSGVRIERVD